MSKKITPKKDNLPLLLLVLCCVALVSFWFFRAKTAQAPDESQVSPIKSIKLLEPEAKTTPSNLNEIDKELKALETQEKSL